MSNVGTLRQARDSYVVKEREFIRLHARCPGCLHCFFEGYDGKYYGPRIDLLYAKPWFPIVCGGKAVVLRLYSVISSAPQYRNAKTAFFVDADFDDSTTLPAAPNVYVTSRYSVENYYVSESVMRRVLEHEFSTTEGTDDGGFFNAGLNAFNARLRDFTGSMLLCNAWILAHRIAEAKSPGTSKLNVQSLHVRSLLNIDIQGVTGSYSVADLERLTGATYKPTTTEISNATSILSPLKWEEVFRGKFQAQFMRTFLARLVDDANKAVPALLPTRKIVSLHVSDKNFLSEMSQFADMPPDLRAFMLGLP